jgi:hypothetical protein
MTTLVAELESVLHALCGCWNRRELGGIRALWDHDEPEPYLLPQEVAQPIIGWPGFDTHWKKTEARLKRCSMRIWDVHAKLLAPDVAMALYKFHWNGDIVGFDHLVGIDSRATATFRRRDGAWKFIAYVEAQSAPLLHLQRYYLMNVDESFR